MAVDPAIYKDALDGPDRVLELRFRTDVGPGHTRVRVFGNLVTGLDQTLAKLGELTFRNEEWAVFAERVHLITADGRIATTIVPDDR